MKNSKSLIIIVATIFLISTAFITNLLDSTPMSEQEALSYIEEIKQQTHTPGGRHKLDEVADFFLSDDGKPFYTVNLYKFHDIAQYQQNVDLSVSGAQAYKLFSKEMIKLLISNNSYPIFSSNWLNYSEKGWDRIVIVRYANRESMAKIFANEKFSIVSKHKWASIAKHDRFIVQAIHLPELTVVLLILFIFMTAIYLFTFSRRSQ